MKKRDTETGPLSREKRAPSNLLAIGISLLSFCVAASSLLISYKNYEHSQAEDLKILLFPRSSNDSASLVNSTSTPGACFLFVFWDCLLINNGDRPLTITRYDLREQHANGSMGAYSLPATFLDEKNVEVILPVRLERAEGRLLRMEIPLRPTSNACAILQDELPSTDDFTWDQVVMTLFNSEMDIYGNKVDFVQLGTSGFPSANQTLREQHFKVTLVTGRGAEFTAAASLYGTSVTREYWGDDKPAHNTGDAADT